MCVRSFAARRKARYESNPTRFALERKLLAQYHPGCKLIKQNDLFSVQFQVQTHKRTYLLKGVFPNTYPNSPMVVKIVKPAITDYPPHFFGSNGGLCIYGSNNYGPETTAKVYIDWAKQWIKCYENWQETGKWPVTNGR
jgi:hypothetical protein